MMITTADQSTRHIQAYFDNDPGFVLKEASGRESLSDLFEYELTLFHDDLNSIVDPATVIGLGATLQIQIQGQPDQEYFGIVRDLQQTDWSDRGVTYRATIVPSLWFLTQRNNCRIFHEKKTDQIIETVLKDAGINDFEFKLKGQYSEREYCVQYRETDFNFISRLLEEEGIYYYFKHENGKHTLVMCDHYIHYYNCDVDTFHFLKPGQAADNESQLLEWQERFQFIPGSVSQKDFNFKTPGNPLFSSRASLVQLANNGACEIYDYHGRYFDPTTGKHLTEVRMGEFEKDYQTGFSRSQHSCLRPAAKFRFGLHCLQSRIGNEYVVTSSQFKARGADYATGAEAREDDMMYENRFTCIPADRTFRPTRRARRPFVQGPQTAIVVTDGEEIMVDEFGRVKVQFHWDRYHDFSEESSCWIRVSQVHAGQGWGMMDIPRRNEEVIVSFIEGDPDRPIITGRVYNGVNSPPFDLRGEKNKQNKTRRGNATQTVGGGGFNEMSMDDTPGQEQIRINGQHNMDTNVGNNETHAVGVDLDTTIGNNETRSVGVDQALTVGSNRSVTVNANHMETIGAAQTVNVTADQTSTIGASQNNNIAANQSNSIGSTQSNQIGMARNTMVGAMDNEMVGFIKTINAGVAMLTTVGALNAEQVAGVKSIIAGTTFKVQCGASSLTMDAAGTITLQGTKILLDSSGPVKVNGSVIDLN